MMNARAHCLALSLLACSGEAFTGGETARAGGGASGVAGSAVSGAGGSQAGSTAAGGGGSPGGAGGAPGAGTGPGGMPAAGAAGAGGAGEPHELCAQYPLPPRAEWAAVAKWGLNPERAIDGFPETRYTTNQPQDGGEWIEVDFGRVVALTAVSVECCQIVDGFPESLDDWGRGFAVRLSLDFTQDFTANVIAEVPGSPDGVTIELGAPRAGRYLLLSQTGVAAESWWSVHELTPACE